jgi:hypothetical protein
MEFSVEELTGNLKDDPGLCGEFLVYDALRALPPPRRFVWDAYIPTKDSMVKQIDLLLIHPAGLYVFESKNWTCRLSADGNANQWVLRYKSRTRVKQNPFVQNDRHIEALCDYFPQLPQPKSVIALGNGCKVQRYACRSGSNALCYHYRELAAEFLPLLATQPRVLSPAQVEYAYRLLEPLSRIPPEIREAHAAWVSATYGNKSINLRLAH